MDYNQETVIPIRGLGYEALETQFDFHESTSLYKGYSGPVGSGKSFALCWEAIRLCYENPGRLGLIGAPTYNMIKDTTQVALFDLLKGAGIPYEHNKADNVLTLSEIKSRILFRPMEEFERLRGTNLAWFGLDELTYTPEEAWTRLEARLRDPKANRLCGFAVWTPKGFDWVYRRFIENPAREYKVFRAKPKENTFLRPDYYDTLKLSYDERLFQQECLGEYLPFNGGAVYNEFDRSRHLFTPITLQNMHALLWSLDFNVNPMCSVVAQHDGETLWILDEIFLKNATTKQACMAFAEKYEKFGGEIVIYGDASGRAHKTTGYSDYDVIQDYLQNDAHMKIRLDVLKSNPPVNERVHLVNRQLQRNDKTGIQIDPKCKELIADLERVSYKGDSGIVDKDTDRMRTHMSDALGYLVWGSCDRGNKIGEQPNRML